jgi:translation initiation factor IF-3
LRINREIRAPKVRVIGPDGEQVGVMTVPQALYAAEEAGLDLVEVSPNAEPPVCKIVDYGKYRYQQTKKEKESKKAQHQVKVKEIKLKPNIDQHDLETKLRHAREFIQKGDKVRVTCTFRGRELMYTDKGQEVINYLCDQLADIATPESPAKLLGKILSTVLAPGARKK